MTTPKTVKIKRVVIHDPDLTESREKNSFRFAVKRRHLVAAYSLILLAMFIVLYSMDITAETIAQNIFPIRIALVAGTLISAVLFSILLHLYSCKLKLLEERDRLIAEIRHDLAHVRTLRGLVSVCSYCKKIRNGKGYWEQIEAYVTNNSHAQFSHGICPECMVSLQREQMVRLLEIAMSADK